MRFRMYRWVGIMGALALTPVFVSGCTTAAYNIQERFGIEKRDILVDRVQGVAKSQTEAKEEFEDALEAFRAVVDVNAGELESVYDDLNQAYDRAEGQADDVRSRVASVKRVARDLFKEWEGELNSYSDAGLRRASERQLRETERRYEALTDKMDAATASMNPVLSVFNDRVLYLKHNLNARAIAALNTETADLEDDVARLIADMEQSISAADAFIKEMNGAA
jgi:PAS domain-containing protein